MLGKRLEKGILKAEQILRFRENNWYGFDNLTEEERNRIRGLLKKTPKACSCWMCGNPRKYFGEIPLRESRQIMEAYAQLEDELGFPKHHLRSSGEYH